MRLSLQQWMKKDFDIETELVVATELRQGEVENKEAPVILALDGQKRPNMKVVWFVDLYTFLPFIIQIPFENHEKAKHFRDKYFDTSN